MSHSSLFTLLPHAAPLWAIAEFVRSRGQGHLPSWTVFLPTQQAAHALVGTLRAQGGARVELPRIYPFSALPISAPRPKTAVLSNWKRRIFLCQYLLKWASSNPNHAFGQAFHKATNRAWDMAEGLGDLLDTFEREEIPFSCLSEGYWGESSQHNEDSFSFLQELTAHYTAHLMARGLVSETTYQIQCLDAETAFWERKGVTRSLVIAGSTGSLKATARLLRAAAHHRHGHVILPGWNPTIDPQTQKALTPCDAHFTLKILLETLDLPLQTIVPLPSPSPRHALLDALFCPAATTHRWAELHPEGVRFQEGEEIRRGLVGLFAWEADSLGDEALGVAHLARQALAGGAAQRVLIVTPDRVLARRLRHELGVLGLKWTDSGGMPLSESSSWVLIERLLTVCGQGFSAHGLLSILRHPGVYWQGDAEMEEVFSALDLAILRQMPVGATLKNVFQRMETFPRSWREGRASFPHPSLARVRDETWDAVTTFGAELEALFAPLCTLSFGAKGLCLGTCTEGLLEVLRALGYDHSLRIIEGERGAFLEVFEGMIADGGELYMQSLHEYRVFLEQTLQGVPSATPPDTDTASVEIVGLLQARLMSGDRVILCGLNEGIWPRQGGGTPWLDRSQKSHLGLPSPERDIGRMAHDFFQACGGERVWLTWSAKRDGSLCPPSRFVLRLKALCEAVGASFPALTHADVIPAFIPAPQEPSTSLAPPCPPLALRPMVLPFTAIDLLVKNPYVVYGRHILGLTPLARWGEDTLNRDRGMLFHTIVHGYHTLLWGEKKAHTWPHPERLCALEKIAHQHLAAFLAQSDPGSLARTALTLEVEAFIPWFCTRIEPFDASAQASFSEISGSFFLPPRCAPPPTVSPLGKSRSH